MTRVRLDVTLVERGLAPTRKKAQARIMAGDVRVNGAPATKPGAAVPREARIEVAAAPSFVGRGALKLQEALDRFGVGVALKVAIDVGASTGGFTEVLLARGARRVYAVDVGRAQLHERLRQDPRVVSLERINARNLSLARVKERCATGVMDVSFISVLKILPALSEILEPGADLVTLVKPQFEVGKGLVGKGGIVKDPELQCEALTRVALSSRAMGYGVLGACASPILGARGNREFFLHLRPSAPGLDEDGTRRAARQAVFA